MSRRVSRKRGRLASDEDNDDGVARQNRRGSRNALRVPDIVDEDIPVQAVIPTSEVTLALARVLDSVEEQTKLGCHSSSSNSNSNSSSSNGNSNGNGLRGRKENERIRKGSVDRVQRETIPIANGNGSGIGKGRKRMTKCSAMAYDADSEDEQVVSSVVASKKRGKKGLGASAVWSLDAFERLVEFLEHFAFFTKRYKWQDGELEALEDNLKDLKKCSAEIHGRKSQEGKVIDDVLAGVSEKNEVTFERVIELLKFLHEVKQGSGKVAEERAAKSSVEQSSSLFPFSFGSLLTPLLEDQSGLKQCFEHWQKKHEKNGPLLRRFQKSPDLVNWHVTDSIADEIDTVGNSCSLNQFRRSFSFATLQSLKTMKNELSRLEHFLQSTIGEEGEISSDLEP